MTGWNPQQDPYGGQPGQPGGPYGGQPGGQYGGSYGGQYGGQYGAGPQPAGYPEYAGGYGPPPPPPPKKSRLPIVVSVVAIVAVVGAVLTIVLLNREDEPAPAAAGSTSSSRPPPPSLDPPSSRRGTPPSGQAPSTKDGWQPVEMPGGGSYQVPGDWTVATEPRRTGLGIDFTGGAVSGRYECGGSTYFRGFTAGGEVQGRGGAPIDLDKAVTDFATAFAQQYYREPKLEPGEPEPTTVDGQRAATMNVKLTVTPQKPECDATSGEVAIVGVEIEEGGQPAAVRMLVVVNDLAGGPGSPAALPDPLAEEILGTLKVG